MKQLAVAFLFVAAWALPFAPVVATAPSEPDVEVETIINKALERATWAQEQNFEARFRHSMTQRARKFNGDGEVTEDETLVYTVEPYQGVPYAKLLTKDGEPIAGDDLKDEEKRREDFLEMLAEPPKEEEEEEDENSIIFNEELLERFTAELTGIQDLRGRPTFVLEFEPRSGKLPERRQMDKALNKSRGQLWIDQETYEIAKVNFEMKERVRLWWGILGSISEVTGQFEREPVADDVWLNSKVDMYFHVRVLFSTSRRGQTTLWDEFEPVPNE